MQELFGIFVVPFDMDFNQGVNVCPIRCYLILDCLDEFADPHVQFRNSEHNAYGWQITEHELG